MLFAHWIAAKALKRLHFVFQVLFSVQPMKLMTAKIGDSVSDIDGRHNWNDSLRSHSVEFTGYAMVSSYFMCAAFKCTTFHGINFKEGYLF